MKAFSHIQGKLKSGRCRGLNHNFPAIPFLRCLKSGQRTFSSDRSTTESFHSIYSFGDGKHHQLGLGKTKYTTTPQKIPSFTLENTDEGLGVPSKRHRFLDVGGGHVISYAINDQYEPFLWGDNEFGHFGLETAPKVPNPQFMKHIKNLDIYTMATGRSHSLFLSKKKQVYSCGNNEFGQLGYGEQAKERVDSSKIAHELHLVDTLKGEKIVLIAAGGDHNIALSENGKAWSWGFGVFGQLGHSGEKISMGDGIFAHKDINEPKEIQALKKVHIARAACAMDVTVLLSEDGQIFTFGNGTFGALGTEPEELSRAEPKMIASLKDQFITSIACSSESVFAINEDLNLYSWGQGDNGILGHGDSKIVRIPKIIEALKNRKVIKVTAGYGHALALTEDGTLYSWGDNGNGQLGLGDNNNRETPTPIEFFKGKKVVDFACGYNHTLVVVEDAD